MREFYRLNPRLIERYQPFMMERKKFRQDTMSDVGWANGLYVGRAVSACFPKGKAYPSEPLKLYSSAEENETAAPITDADRFSGFAAAFNAQFRMKNTVPETQSQSENNIQ